MVVLLFAKCSDNVIHPQHGYDVNDTWYEPGAACTGLHFDRKVKQLDIEAWVTIVHGSVHMQMLAGGGVGGG